MSRRPNTKARASIVSSSEKRQSNGEPEKNIWSSMLDSVASGKKLPEKNIIVLGGNPETQKEVLETLEPDTLKRPEERHRKPPISNRFALGYTYQDVLDTDHEDILARLSLYLLSEASPSFAPLLKPLLNIRSVPETLLVILLDWSEPWLWVRQLRDWIRFMRGIILSLDDETKDVMEETMKEWQQRRRGGSAYDASGSSGAENVTIPLSQGEWDEPLGLPLSVVCHCSNKIEILEKEHSWREEEFDYVLQFLRTVLMKHGASLIYTSPSSPNSLPTLIHSSLGIHSLLKRQSLKHNVIDRDKVIVPPNWDSWGKIRVLREGFDVEGVSSGWSNDIQIPSSSNVDTTDDINGTGQQNGGAVLPIYEQTLPAPHPPSTTTSSTTTAKLDTPTPNTQDFLTGQLALLERIKADEEKAALEDAKNGGPTNMFSDVPSTSMLASMSTTAAGSAKYGRVDEQIGPVQFNMGGIQVDADDMLRRLKQRSSSSGENNLGTPEKGAAAANSAAASSSAQQRGTATPDREGKAQNEALASFFAGLMKRGGGGGGGSPKPGGT